MSGWQLAVLCGLAGVLAAGFAWYERSRPSSRLVALVAALAALAVAGRLVLTPIPNVVATTDIALLTGYALGAAPGFAVGALAAPISNLWLGQGPWTPWQMAGWGLAGLAGALLALLSARRLGRVGLAVACGLAGLGYGALLDLSVMVTAGGEQTLERYLAISARGLPFNIAHALGNFAIALAAGPALVRMISRYRERLEFRWHRSGELPASGASPRAPAPSRPGALHGAPALLVAVALTGLALASTALTTTDAGAAEPAPRAAIGDARVYLERVQNGDGGYAASPGDRSSVTMTGWAALGLEAAGRNPLDVRTNGDTPIDYLRRNADRLRSVGDFERTILVVEAAGLSSKRFGGRDLVRELLRKQSRDGSWQGQVNLTAYGALALRAAGGEAEAIRRAGTWLRRARNGDGGWGFGAGIDSEPDSTGAAMQGLAVAGGGAASGVRYLRSSQRREGGWGLNEDGVTNAQSTAWAVQGLIAARVEPNSIERGGRSGMDYLGRVQARDGHYAYSRSSDQTPIWVTGQALVASSREALPIEPVGRSASPTPSPDLGDPEQDQARLDEPTSDPAEAKRPAAAAADPGGDAEADAARGREAKRRVETSDGRAVRTRGERGEDRSRSPAATEAARLAAAAAETPGSAGRGSSTGWALGGLGGLALALGAGFFWYRRRLEGDRAA